MAIGSLRATEHAVARAWESFTSGQDTVTGVRTERWRGFAWLVVLAPAEIRYAEADRNTVWLSTNRARPQAATRGLDNVEQALRRPHTPEVRRLFGV